MEDDAYKIVIIGGGVAGLFAAKTLVESGRYGSKDVAIIEAQDYLGGRIRTEWVDGSPVELGAQWIHGRGENPLWKYAVENNIPISDSTNTDGEGVFLSTSGTEPPERILNSTLAFLEEVHCSVSDALDDKGCLKEGFPMSVGQYFKARFEEWLRQFQGVEEEFEISWRKRIYNWRVLWENCDCGCNDLNENSIYTFAAYEEFEGGNACFANGYDSFVHSVVGKIKGKLDIFLDKEVVKVKKDDVKECMVIECGDGSKFTSESVMVTLSLGVLQSSMHLFDYQSIQWPLSVLRALHHLAFGSISYVKLEFEDRFWDEDLPGIMVLREDESHFKETYEYEGPWVNYIYGFDGVLHHPNVLMGWLSGEQSRAMELYSDEYIGRQLTQLLAKVMPQKYLKAPIKLKRIYVTRWNQNKYVKGTYSYATTQCVQMGIRHSDLCTPILHSSSGKIALILAGEATSDESAGTVHGALLSGINQAKQILSRNM